MLKLQTLFVIKRIALQLRLCLSLPAVLLLAACGPTSRPQNITFTPADLTTASTPVTQTVILPNVPNGNPASTPSPSPEPIRPTIPAASPTPSLPPSPTPVQTITFAVIGDYGWGDQPEADVAGLVQSWDPDFVITTGDNNYPAGAAETIDTHIGQFYHNFIFPYTGSFGPGAETNRFFPALGNHDWMAAGAQPYLDYFTLPGNERYYDFTWGPVHFYALDSDSNEPDGVSSSSVQAAWLQARLAESQSPWDVVYMHQPPYSSGIHGSIEWARWPYQAWGAEAVLGGHDHTYERLLVDDIPYFVNGMGGGPIYDFDQILPESQTRYNQDYGAMRVEGGADYLLFQFITRAGAVVDELRLDKNP